MTRFVVFGAGAIGGVVGGPGLPVVCLQNGVANETALLRHFRDVYAVRVEAEAVLAAAGIDVATTAEDTTRRGDHLDIRPIDDAERAGGSSWQSLARGTGSIETDLFNGEIVLLGRLHGVLTPVNEGIQRVARELARSGAPPGSMTPDELRTAVWRQI